MSCPPPIVSFRLVNDIIVLMDKRIVVTGGHLTPALAVIEELRKQGWEIIFIGRKYALEGEKTLSVEYKTVNDLGIKFFSITTGRLQRSFTRYTLFSLTKIPLGVIQSFYWLIKFRPKVIVSFGSYVALPVALAGWLLRIPIITHEQSVVPGLATKIISRFAQKICISWPETEKYFFQEKVILTGNPIRPEIFKSAGAKLAHSWGVSSNLPLIYITGGSLGAHVINKAVGQILPELLKKYRLVHQCGDAKAFNDYENLQFMSSKLPSPLKERYFLAKYVESQDIGWILGSADLVICRAGANTVSELAALGKPAVLIPLPWAGQKEQMENAKLLEEAGTAVILPQERLAGESLFQTIDSLIKNIDHYKNNGQKAKSLIKSQAAQRLAEIVGEIAHETR